MKYKTTKKAIKNGYDKIIGIGYCNLQYLLYYQNEISYIVNNYGWACDCYDINNVCISTGYSYIKNQNINIKNEHFNELVNFYNNKAENIHHDNTLRYETKRSYVNELLNEFIKLVIE
jgi:hypothetical protein